jgi:arginase
MTVIVVPFHHDERLQAGRVPVPAGAVVVAPELPGDDIWQRMTALHDAAAGPIAAAVRAGEPATVLSGDCLVGMAVLAGAQRAGVDPAIVWFDAHGDVQTLQTSASGYLGGMALRLVLGVHYDLLAGPLGVTAPAEDRAVLVGARDLDPPEEEYLRSAAVRRSTVAELDAAGLPAGPLLLHLDLDVIDPDDLPGLLFPTPGGPPAAEVIAAVRRVMATGRVCALDIACTWHPSDNADLIRSRATLIGALLDTWPPAG